MAKKIYRLIIVITFTLFISNVCCAELNEELIKVADEYLKSRVGEDYFNQYFAFRFLSASPDKEISLSEPITTAYACYFHKIIIGLNQPDIGYNLDMPIYVKLDSKDEEWEVIESNVPGCLEGDKNCNPFKITKKEAIQIADDYNIVNDCPRGWFIHEPKYDEDTQAFVWEFDCYKDINETSIKAHIDAATGEIKFIMGYSTWGLDGTLKAFE